MRKLLLVILIVCLSGCGSLSKEKEEQGERLREYTDHVFSTVGKTFQDIKKEKQGKVRISFVGVGDNLLHMPINEEADLADGVKGDGHYDYSDMYRYVKEDIEAADLAFINQETILGGSALGISGYPTFNSPADVADTLRRTGFDIVNTASNHSLDRFQEGIDNSHAVWESAEGMIAAGTYVSKEDRNTIRTIKRKGITFSFLAYTYGTNGIEAPHEYSVAYFDEEQIKKDVAVAKKISDVLIVSAHWGDENSLVPNEFQKHYAQLFADLGVDIVIGTHPHVIQPVEYVERENGEAMPVVYSLGNFMSGMLETNNILSGMICLDFVIDKSNTRVTIEHIRWQPLVTHYSGDAGNIGTTRKNFTVYKLNEYSETNAAAHGLNGYNGQKISTEDLYERTKAVIKEIPIVE